MTYKTLQQYDGVPLSSRGGRLTFPTPRYQPGAAYVGTQDLRTPYGKDMPASEVRPLGTKKSVDTAPSLEVDSIQLLAITPHKEKQMTITLKTLSKNGKQAYYSGAAQILRFPLGVFPGKVAPASFTVTDDLFAPASVKEAKPKLTAEERKAARAAKPKPTLAEL
ncbi:MAG: hypothetical protein V4529_16845, partial [Gemmatimonadota bacterium]